MSDDERAAGQAPMDDQVPPLPEHLSVLVGSMHGPADLGRLKQVPQVPGESVAVMAQTGEVHP